MGRSAERSGRTRSRPSPGSARGGTARKPAKAPRLSFVDDAYARIKALILDNEMPPGFQALEAELAVRFGMSRTPVREALLRLQAEGFVRVERRRGMRVLPIAPEDMAEIYAIVTALETMGAELLAARVPREAELEPLAGAVADMEAALAGDDLEGWAEADERFHRGLLELCGARRLAAAALTFRDQVRRTRMLTLRLRPKPTRSTEAHRALVEALRRGDPEAAGRIHRGQRERASRELIDILRRHRLSSL